MGLNVSLTKALEDFINRNVASGRYGSASEVVREALRLLEHRERLREAQIADLRGELSKGIAQLDAGASVAHDMASIKVRAREQPKRRRK